MSPELGAAGPVGEVGSVALSDRQRVLVERYRLLPRGRGLPLWQLSAAEIAYRLELHHEPVPAEVVAAYLEAVPPLRRIQAAAIQAAALGAVRRSERTVPVDP
jgi:hypothetical protein